jgi:hypothetical protein
LERVLPLCGGRPDCHDRRKWHTPAGTLSVTGAKFMNWTLGAGGGGAVDLVMQIQHLDFKGALDWLAGHFAGVLPPEPVSPCLPTGKPPCASALRLPPPAPGQLARVQDYLIAQRRLPPRLLAPLSDSGTLYADARANAVFLLHDPNRQPVGAELRGTTPRAWHGLAPGSRKDLGCFAIPLEPRPTVVLCESAIDAISCFALHPGYRCLSTAGARPSPQWLGPLLDQGCQVYCGFDADPTGDTMAQTMVSLHPAVQRLRPSRHDWNDVLRARG